MRELINSEFERIAKNKKIKIIFIALILITLFEAVFIKFIAGGNALYTPNFMVRVSSCDFPILAMRDIEMFFVFIVFPVIFFESFVHEYEIGAYRNILIRPCSRSELIISKIISQSILSFIFVVAAFIFLSILGLVFFPHVDIVKFYKDTRTYTQVGAFFYSLRFFLMFYIYSISLLTLSAFIGTLVPNSIASYIIFLVLICGGIYVSDWLSVFCFPFMVIVNGLSMGKIINFYAPILICFVISTIITIVLFNKKSLNK